MSILDDEYPKVSGEITVVHVSWEREVQVMGDIAELLERVDPPARDRILRWAVARYMAPPPLIGVPYGQ